MRYSNLNQMLIMNFEIVRVYRKYYTVNEGLSPPQSISLFKFSSGS